MIRENIMEDRTVSSNSFCTECGAPIQPGSRFCDRCGAPVGSVPGGKQRKAPAAPPRGAGEEKTVWDPNPLRSGRSDWEQPPRRGFGPDMDPYPGWEPEPDNSQNWGAENAVSIDGENNNTVRWVLIGAAIGLAVLLLIFGTIHFLKAADDEKEDSKAATTEQTTEAEENDQEYDEPDYDEYDEPDPGNRNEVQSEPQAGWDENNAAYDYSAYRTEAQLYDPYAPVFFPDSSERYLSDYEVSGLNEDQLQKAINDIFARNGLIFETDRFQNYYISQSWYYGYTDNKTQIQNGFSNVEKKNIDLLRKYQ